MTHIPRLVIAAPMSGSGKTTITAGLIAAFAGRGLKVASFKVGPDYIDPTYHKCASGRACSNLDSWMLPPERVRELFMRRARDSDLALIEGVMGLFDGYSALEDAGSTAHIARLLDAPVLLVLDASAMARTTAAIVIGIRDFDPRVRIAGIILNRVGSARHAELVKTSVELHTDIPVIGYLTRDDELYLPERHLGLIPTNEPGKWNEWLEAVRTKIAATTNLDRVFELARTAPPLTSASTLHYRENERERGVIAIARDEAFGFLYEDNLDLLRAAGAKIVCFSPLRDSTLPRGTQAIYLAGGFPELYAEDLAANAAIRSAIRSAIRAGMPVYAECGGLMYLTEKIVDARGAAHPMVGALPGCSVMTGRLTLGYRTVRALHNSWLWRSGETIRGHEFHYSTWENRPRDLAPAYELVSDGASEARYDGARVGNLIASYVHIHFYAQPSIAQRLVSACHGSYRRPGDGWSLPSNREIRIDSTKSYSKEQANELSH